MKKYAVDIDLSNGKQIRDFEVNSLLKAIKYFDKFSKKMMYENTIIDNIQLIEITKQDYIVLNSKFYESNND